MGSGLKKINDTRGLFSDISDNVKQKASRSSLEESEKFGETVLEKELRLSGGPEDLGERKNIADILRKEYPNKTDKELAELVTAWKKGEKK